MRCPFCGNEDTQVKDSRPSEDNAAIRRRRVCTACQMRFTTFERVELREITVIKKDGKRKAFDRDKLSRSLGIAVRKRPVSSEQVERAVSHIVRRIENLSDAEISTDVIGKYVMEALAVLDPIAYVRFASVYKAFREVKDFEDFIETQIEHKKG